MIVRHELAADFELITYTPEMLHKQWVQFYTSYKDLGHSGFTLVEIIELVGLIRDSNLSHILFPGSSVGRLLISKPRNGTLNYQQTLTVSKIWNSNLVELVYDDWDILVPGDSKKEAILWSTHCTVFELKEKFAEFISWKKDWGTFDMH